MLADYGWKFDFVPTLPYYTTLSTHCDVSVFSRASSVASKAQEMSQLSYQVANHLLLLWILFRIHFTDAFIPISYIKHTQIYCHS